MALSKVSLDLVVRAKLLANKLRDSSCIICVRNNLWGFNLEKEILGFVIERNRILEEIIRLNHLAISEFSYLDATDQKHFFLTRKYMIEALIISENKIIAYSMMDWTTFNLDLNYRNEYLMLSREKEECVAEIINQDRILSSLVEGEGLEKTA